jgi:hypothetical protein
MAASALTLTDLTAVSINATRSGNADGWAFGFSSTDGLTAYGSIYDNANSFTDGSTSASAKALQIDVVANSDTIAIQDFDYLTITTDSVTDLKVWLPALAVDDTLYVDTDGNTWYDEALTTPAGGVHVFSETVTTADTFLEATLWFDDTVGIADALGSYEWEHTLSDTITVNESFAAAIASGTLYFNDTVGVRDSIAFDATDHRTLYFNEVLFMSDVLTVSTDRGWTEASTASFTWVEI